MTIAVPAADRDDWYAFALQELKHLQDDFRLLQGQSHAVVGVGVTLTGLSLGVGGKASYSIAGLLATLVVGIAMTWYLSINAAAEIVGRARDELSREINRAMRRGGMKRTVYSDAIQVAGAMSPATMAILVMFGLFAVCVAGAASWLSFQSPQHLGDRFYLPGGWREGAQMAVTGLAAGSVLLSLYENRVGRPRRFVAAL